MDTKTKRNITVAATVTFVVIFGVAFGGAWLLTAPLAEAAEEYLLLVSQGRMDDAYDMTTNAFHFEIERDEFKAICGESGLDTFEDVSWYYRSIEGRKGRLEGTMTTTDPNYPQLGITVILAKEDNEWRIHFVDLLEE